ncbi:DUF2073 domain-containing protein [archaeon]|nr:DUF2073 domain-containing protein [archaeon]
MAKKKKRVIGKKSKDLTIHFMPYSEIAKEDTVHRIKKILGLVLDNKIIILQGRLKPEEEGKLIETTMTLIGNIKGFQGIEISTISGDSENKSLFDKVRHNIARILVGEQDAVTLIGPASVVKEIKRDPKKIELMLERR